jgi:plastocyanin
MHCRKIWVLALAAILLAGCGGGSDHDTTTSAPRAAASGSGIIHGQVLFQGPAPIVKIVSAKDCWAQVPDETVVVNPNGTLKNVIVYLKDGPPGDGGGPPVVLDQHDAHYIPHVIALQVGQPLVVQSSEDHIHNVHVNSAINPQENLNFMSAGQKPPIFFKAPEFFEIKCDVHPWMCCEVGVFDHPYFAVTGDDGSFTITNVPPGNYTLAARHERFGELTQQVTAIDKQTTQATFTYQPPGGLK